MKQFFRALPIVLTILCSFSNTSSAQDCPVPDNLEIALLLSSPPQASINWTAPAGSHVIGFQLTYSINGGLPQTIVLPLAPTQYDITLPDDWTSLQVGLASVCEDGSISETVGETLNNLIIEDMVIGGRSDIPEQKVCTNPCPGGTHFYYSQGSGLNLAAKASYKLAEEWRHSGLGTDHNTAQEDPGGIEGGQGLGNEIFKNTIFCSCMEQNKNKYSDHIILDACRLLARQYVNTSYDDMVQCATGTGRNEQVAQGARESIVLSPNPAGDWLHVYARPGDGQFKCAVSGVTGTCIMPEFIIADELAIPVADWPCGVYFMRITDRNGVVQTKQFVKQ